MPLPQAEERGADVTTKEGELVTSQVATNNRTEKWLPYLLVLPALVLMIGILYPFFTGMYWSLTDYNLSSGVDKQWVGLTNYGTLLTSSDFWNSLRVTLQYTVICLVVQLPLGLAVAMVLAKQFMGVRFFRAVLIMPLMMPPIVAALMWKVMMGGDGVFNYLLSLVGVPAIEWLASAQWSLWSVALIDIWIYTPFCALIFLAGLQSLPKEPFEASQVDGASAWFVFRRLTLPLISPYLVLVTVFRGIDCLKIFDIIYATTKGGPVNASMSLHIQAYYTGIRWTYFGEALAYLMVLWAICYGISFYLTKVWTRSIKRATGY
jgi:multiple sugar transport system permease protein